ncbi:Protein argonaute [Neofusicoccum ribis]|uniref:Protein argonaute n=1 Tax=Neofusicoccum ribis TaxID=45134 RepID=A0ABR3TFF0_9PEZI
MAGAGKRRAKAAAAASSCGEPSSEGKSQSQSQSPGAQRPSPEHSSESRSSPQSLPRFDGNADPQAPGSTLDIHRNLNDTLGIQACNINYPRLELQHIISYPSFLE